ncbi:hypothetical protein SAMN05518865_10122 [Duganella sp. CF458]|uniref:hypothetical protein n=1 Tax=Duganella sp. CF458 TaxID=1884368 RepID=UPI0008E4A9B6|nr:hypothetical protein [Duganella sp. CF458]SFF50690.1 hypothetical protein SAMN05518865_10122 [Duganella sp. CF458]
MSSSRTSAIAGAVAGLLVAGIGAWYASNHKATVATRVAAAAPAPVSAPAAKANVSRDQAVERLMALPELKGLADAIEKRSGGERHGALLETDPAPRDVKGSPYYQLIFVENGDDMAQAVASFLVSHANGEILVEDDISGELMSIDQWRKGLKD